MYIYDEHSSNSRPALFPEDELIKLNIYKNVFFDMPKHSRKLLNRGSSLQLPIFNQSSGIYYFLQHITLRTRQ